MNTSNTPIEISIEEKYIVKDALNSYRASSDCDYPPEEIGAILEIINSSIEQDELMNSIYRAQGR